MLSWCYVKERAREQNFSTFQSRGIFIFLTTFFSLYVFTIFFASCLTRCCCCVLCRLLVWSENVGQTIVYQIAQFKVSHEDFLYRSPTRICSQLNFFLKSFLRSSDIYISRITHSETFKTSTCGRKEKKKFVLLGAICVATAPLASHYKPWISCFV